MATTKEKGNIFFFYRPKVDAESPRDVQRFYFVLHDETSYRLLIVGRKKLPETNKGRDSSLARNWVLVREVTKERSTIEDILEGGEYETKTKGTQHLPPAAPLAEGRYAIVEYDGQTALVYKLKREQSDEVSELFGLQKEASMVLAVKNPEVQVEGFPEAKPDYPGKLTELFKDRRWIPVEDTKLLDYADVQLLMISALDEEASEELGISLEKSPDVDLLSEIDLDLPKETLLENAFPKLKEFEKKHHELKDIRFGEGGKKGGKQASKKAQSASGIASLLSGIDLPKEKDAILEYAEEHEDRVDNSEIALSRLNKIANKEYNTMADIQKAISETMGEPPFRCEICGEEFETPSELKQHIKTSHPAQAVSAADIEKALNGISYPKKRKELVDQAKKNEAEEETIEAIKSLPDKNYADAAEVAVAFKESITGEERDEEEAPSKKALKSDSAAAITKALKGIELPKKKEGIVAYAKEQNPSGEVMEVLDELPDKTFEDMSDIAKAVGEVKG